MQCRAVQCSILSKFKLCRRVDSSEAHTERAVLREQLDRAYDVLKLKRTEERNMVQDVAQVGSVTHAVMCACTAFARGDLHAQWQHEHVAAQTVLFESLSDIWESFAKSWCC